MSKKIKCLIYCTKAYPYLTRGIKGNVYPSCAISNGIQEWHLNGKVVAQFECEKIERFDVPYPAYFWEVKDKLEHITNNSCMSLMNLHHYLKNESGYAIHISNLEIFKEPKELTEYCKRLPSGDFQVLGKAPQNMMNVCEIKYYIEDYILISIKPEWVEKILNGEKTIEVRKKILKKMEELI